MPRSNHTEHPDHFWDHNTRLLPNEPQLMERDGNRKRLIGFERHEVMSGSVEVIRSYRKKSSANP